MMNDFLIFSKRLKLAEKINDYIAENDLVMDAYSVITALSSFGMLNTEACKKHLDGEGEMKLAKKVKVTRYEFGNYSGFIEYVELSPLNVCDTTTVHFSSRTMFWIDDKLFRFYDASKIFYNLGAHDILDVVPEYYEEPDTDDLGRPFCKAIHIALKDNVEVEYIDEEEEESSTRCETCKNYESSSDITGWCSACPGTVIKDMNANNICAAYEKRSNLNGSKENDRNDRERISRSLCVPRMDC